MNKETTLLKLKTGEKALVKEILGGKNVKEKLNAMGIYPGAEIKKSISPSKGPIIAEILRYKIAIGRGMAEKIIVYENNPDGKS
ncbi:MAG: ferrous iron transport protein A [Elusimicrobia bacterium]|nr:ferrous iron transport protein A [Elusimicrobiota bacterium]